MSRQSEQDNFELRQKYHYAITDILTKLSNHFVFNLPLNPTDWPEMRKYLEEIRIIIDNTQDLNIKDKALVKKYLVEKPMNKKTKRNTKKKQTTNNKSLLECTLNKQGISLSDIDENYNLIVKKSKSQEVSEDKDQP